jgi:hypothetical protein
MNMKMNVKTGTFWRLRVVTSFSYILKVEAIGSSETTTTSYPPLLHPEDTGSSLL